MTGAASIPLTPGSVRVSEIFLSLQGESSRVGLPTVFIRLTGCPLRCRWCDTEHAFSGGETLAIPDVIARARSHGTHIACVTGGEPLAQKNCLPLLSALCDAGFDVSLETSGALDIAGVDPRVSRIMDLKAPGSGEQARNLWRNLEHLTPRDELKIVIANRADYDWACATIAGHALRQRCPVLLSPVPGELDPRVLADWIVATPQLFSPPVADATAAFPVRFQLQLHKVLWGNMRSK